MNSETSQIGSMLDLSGEKTEILIRLVEYINAIDALQFGFLFDRDFISDIQQEYTRRCPAGGADIKSLQIRGT